MPCNKLTLILSVYTDEGIWRTTICQSAVVTIIIPPVTVHGGDMFCKGCLHIDLPFSDFLLPQRIFQDMSKW